MALRFVDGFDFWTTAPGCWTSSTAGLTVTSGKLTIPGSSATTRNIRWTFPGTYSTVIVNIRVAFAAKTVFQDEPIFSLYDGDSVQCTLTINSAGQLAVKRGAYNGTQIGSFSAGGLVLDSITYYDIEAKINVADSGTCVVRVNGSEVLNVSGDLASTTNQNCNNILFGKASASPTNSEAMYFEHVIIMDTSGSSMNDFIGPVKVNPHYLTADGNYTDFAANTGDRWDAVNDLDPDGDTTYISANAVGNKYTAVASNLPAGITTVHALAVWAKSKRDDDVTRAYKALLRYSSTDQLSSTDKYIGPGYAYQMSSFDQSPFTDSAWTTTEVDGLEVGVQITV